MAFWSSRKKAQQQAAEEAAAAEERERDAARRRILDEADRQRRDRDLNGPTLINSTVPLTVGQRYGYRPRLVLADRKPANRGRW